MRTGSTSSWGWGYTHKAHTHGVKATSHDTKLPPPLTSHSIMNIPRLSAVSRNAHLAHGAKEKTTRKAHTGTKATLHGMSRLLLALAVSVMGVIMPIKRRAQACR